MKIPKPLVYLVAVNMLILIGIAGVQLVSQQLAYHVGGVYAGIILGVCFSLVLQPSLDHLRGQAISDIFIDSLVESFRRGQIIQRRGHPIIFVVMGLLVLMTIIGDYTFFGQTFDGKGMTALVVMTVVGLYYGMFLGASESWFGLWIARGKFLPYVFAFSYDALILYFIGIFSILVFPTPFFL